MERINDFIKYLKKEYENHACYLWGGQGEYVLNMKPAIVRNKETSEINAGRVLAHVGGLMKLGKINANTKYFDCSGLGVWWFLEHELIKSDTTADGLLKRCKEISFGEVKKGDMIFKVNAKRTATHVAYIINKDGDYIEMRGRDDGICKGNIHDPHTFTVAGRPNFNWE